MAGPQEATGDDVLLCSPAPNVMTETKLIIDLEQAGLFPRFPRER